jgi:micrococcal nuclease
MQFLRVAVTLLFPLLQLHTVPPAWRSEAVVVRAVVDGDTITVAPFGRVNLLGIEAPHLSTRASDIAPFAVEARERLSSIVLNRWVRLETDGQPITKAGRRIAYVFTEDGQFVNATLVREGLARASSRSGARRLDELERAQRDAQIARRGMWGGAPRIPDAGYTPPSKRSR